ncbi:hypothetical protein CPB85DRAFT_1300831 [Mucidula mucida]|nr:hypothetical protein CPB85DRAFT_1300831 [Mucidula mucida]
MFRDTTTLITATCLFSCLADSTPLPPEQAGFSPMVRLSQRACCSMAHGRPSRTEFDSLAPGFPLSENSDLHAAVGTLRRLIIAIRAMHRRKSFARSAVCIFELLHHRSR